MARSLLPAFADELDTSLLLHDCETDAIVDANAGAGDLYGYPVAQLRELDIADITTDLSPFSRERARERIQAAAGGDEQLFEWQITRANNELRWVRVRLQRTELAGETWVLAEQQDITESKIRSRRLRLLSRIVRHNLRNDVSVIQGHADMLTEDLEAGDAQQQAALIAETAASLGAMSDSVRQVQEIASNDITDFIPTNVARVLDTLAAAFSESHPDATLEIDCPDDVFVSADVELHYGLTHAIENAIEHHDSNGPTVEIDVETRGDPPRVSICVTDSGPPIPECEIKAVEIDETDLSEMRHGSGVGLFVIQWCAESLGGTLYFEQRSPRGNRVEFVCPRLVGHDG